MSETTAKLKINSKEGIIEVEGSEKFIFQMLNEHKELFIPQKEKITPPKEDLEQEGEGDKIKRRKIPPETIEAIDVDLNAGVDYPDLKDFYNKKKPVSFIEKTTLFTYYLKEYKKIEEATPGHLLTCYRGVGSKLPKNIPQTILDAKNLKGWMTTDSGKNIAKISNLGINLVEQELPRKIKD